MIKIENRENDKRNVVTLAVLNRGIPELQAPQLSLFAGLLFSGFLLTSFLLGFLFFLAAFE